MTPGDVQPRDEESLGARFQRGEDEALHEMYRRYSGPMFVTAISLLGDREQAADGPSLERIWRSWQVREALDELSREERQVLELAYFQGLSQSQIARRLDIALGTVKSRTSRAQRRLAALLPHLRETAQAVAS